MSIEDIKDRKPNPDTIRILERLLDEAKRGEVRTIVYICGYDDDSWGNGWVVDSRNTARRMIGELTMLHFDFIANQSLQDDNTVLSRIDKK